MASEEEMMKQMMGFSGFGKSYKLTITYIGFFQINFFTYF